MPYEHLITRLYMLRVLIVDSDITFTNGLKSIISQIDMPMEVMRLTSRESALDLILGNEIDLFIISTDISRGDGLKLLKDIRKLESYKTALVIILASDVSMKKTILKENINFHDYFVKPINENMFMASFLKAIDLKLVSKNPHIILGSNRLDDYNFNRDIVWVYSENKKTNFYLKNGSIIAVSSYNYTIKEVVVTLGDKFIRVHKSYIVNIRFIEKIEDNYIYIKETNKIIKIGRSFMANVRACMG